MTSPKPAPHLSDWAREHLARYLATDGAEGEHWPSAVAPQYGAVPALLLTVTGRQSGERYIMPLYYGETEGRHIIIASKGGADVHPGWYLNVLADPRVQVQVGRKKFDAIARTATGAERQRLWDFMVRHYPPYGEYQVKTTREIPVVVLDPQTGADQ